MYSVEVYLVCTYVQKVDSGMLEKWYKEWQFIRGMWTRAGNVHVAYYTDICTNKGVKPLTKQLQIRATWKEELSLCC